MRLSLSVFPSLPLRAIHFAATYMHCDTETYFLLRRYEGCSHESSNPSTGLIDHAHKHTVLIDQDMP